MGTKRKLPYTNESDILGNGLQICHFDRMTSVLEAGKITQVSQWENTDPSLPIELFIVKKTFNEYMRRPVHKNKLKAWNALKKRGNVGELMEFYRSNGFTPYMGFVILTDNYINVGYRQPMQVLQ
jgi:hypothetical protein